MAHPIVTAIATGLPDTTTLVTNITVGLGFLGIVGAGIMAGIKQVREFRKPSATSSPLAQMAAVTILENATLSEWSRTNRDVIVALSRMSDLMVKHHDELADHRHETAELRHAIRDLRSDLRNKGS